MSSEMQTYHAYNVSPLEEGTHLMTKMTTLQLIGQQLELIRARKGLTQAEAATQCGMGDRTVKDAEAGKQNLTVEMLERFAKGYEVTLGEILQAWLRPAQEPESDLVIQRARYVLSHDEKQNEVLTGVINALYKQLRQAQADRSR